MIVLRYLKIINRSNKYVKKCQFMPNRFPNLASYLLIRKCMCTILHKSFFFSVSLCSHKLKPFLFHLSHIDLRIIIMLITGTWWCYTLSRQFTFIYYIPVILLFPRVWLSTSIHYNIPFVFHAPHCASLAIRTPFSSRHFPIPQHIISIRSFYTRSSYIL